MKSIKFINGARPLGLAPLIFAVVLSLLGWSSPTARLTYLPQRGTPAAIPNFIQPEQACAWAGIGGQVFDQAGAPVSGLVLKLSGLYQGQSILKYAVANSSQQFGPGGFDFYLGSQPLATTTLTLQVLDVGGAPRSSPIRLNTFASCQQNLLVVNLVEVSLDRLVFFPLIRK